MSVVTVVILVTAVTIVTIVTIVTKKNYVTIFCIFFVSHFDLKKHKKSNYDTTQKLKL